MRVLKAIGRFLGRSVLLVMALIVLTVATIGVIDFAVLRNLFTGPAMGRVDQTDRNNPKEAVPGRAQMLVPVAPPNTLDAGAIARAAAYAAETESVALLIYHRGALRYEKYFAGSSAATRTDSFSGHKTVLALTVGAAIADGFIGSVDEPVAKYLPALASDERSAIRIKDLLQMASGLEVPRFPLLTSLRLVSGSDLPGVVSSIPYERAAGSYFQYSNVNPQLLGLVVQKATGKRYAEYLSQRLWSRLGADDAAVWLDREAGTPRTFCCLYATARSWLNVGLLILNKGRVGSDQVLPSSWIESMTTPSAANPNYGYQTWLGSPPTERRKYNDKTITAYHSAPFAAPDMIYIDGFGGQRVYIVPSQDLIIVRTGLAQQNWDDAKLPNAVLAGVLPETIP
jgi:CubicO group peptidase (beta-lactamase class C family)